MIRAGPMTAQFPSLSMPLMLTPPRRRLLGCAAVFLALALLLAWWAGSLLRQSGMEDIEGRGRQRSALYLSSFRNPLPNYEYLPGVLAQDSHVRALLRYPDDQPLILHVHARLQLPNSPARTPVLYVKISEGN